MTTLTDFTSMIITDSQKQPNIQPRHIHQDTNMKILTDITEMKDITAITGTLLQLNIQPQLNFQPQLNTTPITDTTAITDTLLQQKYRQ